jgi:hypothetical protein
VRTRPCRKERDRTLRTLQHGGCFLVSEQRDPLLVEEGGGAAYVADGASDEWEEGDEGEDEETGGEEYEGADGEGVV